MLSALRQQVLGAEMNPLYILLLKAGLCILAYCFVCQFIAFLITPRLDRGDDEYYEAVLSMWVCVTFAPLFAVWLLAARGHQETERMAKYFGMPVEPSDDGGDYIL